MILFFFRDFGMDPRSFLPKIGRIVRVLAEFDVKRFFEI